MKSEYPKDRALKCVLILAVVVFWPVCGYGGSLEPSAGPGSTMKTLDEVEPRIPIPGSSSPTTAFAISSPGSYYLTGERTK